MSDHDPTAGLDLLGEDTRFAILRELAEHQREHPDSRALPFAELRKRVGRRDAGNFNYHLKRLRDRFVESTEDGYRLTYLGMVAYGRLAAGTYAPHDTIGPAELDADCPICGQGMTATYEDCILTVSCPDGHVVPQNFLPPAATTDRDLSDLLDVAALGLLQDAEAALSGVCTFCDGPVSLALTETDADTGWASHAYAGNCRSCGVLFRLSAPAAALVEPAAAAFCARHGANPRAGFSELLTALGNAETVASGTDPPSSTVVVRFGEESVRVRVTAEGVDHVPTPDS
ncbi:winged helix-turn-helix domain-containing protein [Haloarchaeobius amylolyticus]|uniref:winged helix-turn-helix domain-containing protein n=1 Tax=Haloarchaeobius amylolyticus TaxID=1198296 RepID=UPI00226D68D5|nr:winged helix-turn-helix domain-containing protein [Haloarchaeobius amylolyticus]